VSTEPAAAQFCAAFVTGASASPSGETPLVASARELVDTYYGNTENLRRAAVFLAEAYAANPQDANIYIQAGRITIMGAHLSFDAFEGGAFERYAALVDEAIALDPSNAKAHILKAEIYSRNGKSAEEFAELEKAEALGSDDPWLGIGYGRYYRSIRQVAVAYEAYDRVMKRGPGTTASGRKAFVTAVEALCTMSVGGEPLKDKTRKYAAIALQERYPTDAWTPHGFAERFIDQQLFEEAIVYAREALKTMDFGAGRMTLAAALYARAAQLELDNRPGSEVAPLVKEARKLGFPKAQLLEYILYQRGAGSLQFLGPTLNKLIR
jgi:tetratricopeptide (TPR) repeat protein